METSCSTDLSFFVVNSCRARYAPRPKEILSKNYDVKCDVLKLGHHGSSTSTSDRFLEAANPQYAVISCGVDNDYGHPHKETMNKLENFKIETYRTDVQGTILASTDGKTVSITPNQASVIEKAS